MIITLEQLEQITGATEIRLKPFIATLNDGMATSKINTPYRIAAFIAQVSHESGAFRYTKEIASGEAYEGRNDLGNYQAGDGVRFKGRGLIQITGRNNYIQISEDLGTDFINHPERLEEPSWAAISACWFWDWKELNKICDKREDWSVVIKGKVYDKFMYLTRRINGGLNGYPDRVKYFNRAAAIFGLNPLK